MHVCLPVSGAPSWVLLQHSIMLRLFSIAECSITHFLCATHVFKVQASSSSPSYVYLYQISFLLRPPLLASPWSISRTQWITHPAYLMPGNQSAYISEHGYLFRFLSSTTLAAHRRELNQTLQHVRTWARFKNTCPEFGVSPTRRTETQNYALKSYSSSDLSQIKAIFH